MSKGSDNLEQKLSIFLERYNLTFKKEVSIGKNKARYDFFIETEPPIALEFDGFNHKKPNAHFFKTTEAFDQYKRNDNAKNELSRLGKVHLIRTEKEDLSLEELEELFEGYETLLEKGVRIADQKEDYEARRKEAARNYRHKKYLESREKRKAYERDKVKSKNEAK